MGKTPPHLSLYYPHHPLHAVRYLQQLHASSFLRQHRSQHPTIPILFPHKTQTLHHSSNPLVSAHQIPHQPHKRMTMVRGRQIHALDVLGEVGEMADTVGGVKVILAGEGAGTGLQKGSAVEVGKMMGIKGPVWEVVVEGVKWGVGVDWKVLS